MRKNTAKNAPFRMLNAMVPRIDDEIDYGNPHSYFEINS
jgi:hypothetical protein